MNIRDAVFVHTLLCASVYWDGKKSSVNNQDIFFILSFKVLTQLITAYGRPQYRSINNKVCPGNLEFKVS